MECFVFLYMCESYVWTCLCVSVIVVVRNCVCMFECVNVCECESVRACSEGSWASLWGQVLGYLGWAGVPSDVEPGTGGVGGT